MANDTAHILRRVRHVKRVAQGVEATSGFHFHQKKREEHEEQGAVEDVTLQHCLNWGRRNGEENQTALEGAGHEALVASSIGALARHLININILS